MPRRVPNSSLPSASGASEAAALIAWDRVTVLLSSAKRSNSARRFPPNLHQRENIAPAGGGSDRWAVRSETQQQQATNKEMIVKMGRYKETPPPNT